MPPPTIFGNRLRLVRDRRGLSQAELGEQAKVPALMISHFETGIRPSASAATLVKLANALEVSIDYLIGRTDDPSAVSGRVGALFRSLGENATKETFDAVMTMAEALAKKDEKSAEKKSSPAPESDRSE